VGLALRLATSMRGAAASAIAPFEPPPSNVVPLQRVASGARRVNAAGCALISAFEGRCLQAYHDHVGYPTQGVGRLMSRVPWEDLSKYPPIDDATCDAWLREDLDRFARGVSRLVPVNLNDNEFAALVSLSFNVGLGNLQGSTLRRMLLRDDPRDECADQFLRWDKAGGRKSRGLARRRAAERLLFLSQAVAS
jgi:GH24 family phage-related lysozyme (muramidase)